MRIYFKLAHKVQFSLHGKILYVFSWCWCSHVVRINNTPKHQLGSTNVLQNIIQVIFVKLHLKVILPQ